MRAIKFRAWDNNGKDSRMYYPGDRTEDGTRLLLNMHGDVLEARKLHKGEVNHTTDEAYNHAVYPARIGHSLTLMQFIGCRDKNNTGIEVYEHDIVRRRDGKIGTIIWSHAACGFVIAFGDDEPLGSLSSWFEVVGNRFQHPELLKEAA